MKNIILCMTLLFVQPLSGFDFGAGFSWNTIDESFHSKLSTNETKSGMDQYNSSSNRFAPIVQLGHRFILNGDWEGGFLGQWKYLITKHRM